MFFLMPYFGLGRAGMDNGLHGKIVLAFISGPTVFFFYEYLTLLFVLYVGFFFLICVVLKCCIMGRIRL